MSRFITFVFVIKRVENHRRFIERRFQFFSAAFRPVGNVYSKCSQVKFRYCTHEKVII